MRKRRKNTDIKGRKLGPKGRIESERNRLKKNVIDTDRE